MTANVDGTDEHSWWRAVRERVEPGSWVYPYHDAFGELDDRIGPEILAMIRVAALEVEVGSG